MIILHRIDVALELKKYTNQEIIFLKNHGIVFTTDNIDILYNLISNTLQILENIINKKFDVYKFTNYITKLMNNFNNNLSISYLVSNSKINELFNNNSLKTIFS